MCKGSNHILYSHIQHLMDHFSILKIVIERRKTETFDNISSKTLKNSLTIFQRTLGSSFTRRGADEQNLFTIQEISLQPGEPVQRIFKKC